MKTKCSCETCSWLRTNTEKRERKIMQMIETDPEREYLIRDMDKQLSEIEKKHMTCLRKTVL